MSIYSNPPPFLPFPDVKPTLLVCWWITIFCMTIILFRVGGRFVRTERLFPEDKMTALAMVPMFLRMGCVHIILLYGTNNADYSALTLGLEKRRQISTASALVLASRIFYAATLWAFKLATLEFFKRLIGVTWTRSYNRVLSYIRLTLVATFVAVVVADLAECQPFNQYWQVLPDPGGSCRQGYVQLVTMAVCNVITDLMLVFFPIPIILRSAMRLKRKAQLVSLFSLSLAIVGTTVYRVPHIIEAHGSQPLRSLLASVELLAATTAANALVLGSFVRDRGVKKRKFKYGSVSDPLDRTRPQGLPQVPGVGLQRPTLRRHWGSDEDLVRDLGLGVEPWLRDDPYYDLDEEAMSNQAKYTPAAPVAPDLCSWRFPDSRNSGSEGHKNVAPEDASEASLLARENQSPSPLGRRSNSTASPRKVSFFDLSGLLDDTGSTGGGLARKDSCNSTMEPLSQVLSSNASPVPSPAFHASNSGFRRGSTALLQDIGGLLPLGHPRYPAHAARSNRLSGTELKSIPQRRSENAGVPDLIDAGALLDRHP